MKPLIGFGVIIILLAAIAIHVALLVNTPLVLLLNTPHDDELYMRLAANIASDHWLGPFDQFTLMKGAGYPLFLVMAAASGMPVSIAHAFLQIAAISTFSILLMRITRSRLLAAVVFAIVVLMPAYLDQELMRVVRDQIYWAQCLLGFALFAMLLFAPPRNRGPRAAVAIGAGVVLGWAWITREEGLWLLPGLSILVIGKLFQAWLATRRVGTVIASCVVAGAGFALVPGAIGLLNYLHYGSFMTVDVKENGFESALADLEGIVVNGQHIPFAPATNAGIAAAAQVSPTFAPLAQDLAPGGSLDSWRSFGCQLMPGTCGQIAAAWFIWALRDAAALHGFYQSPRSAAVGYKRIADEISQACDTRKLDCRPGLIALMPPITMQQWKLLPSKIWTTMVKAVMLDPWPAGGIASPFQDASPSFDKYWAFLNYPKIIGPKSGTKTAQGWYYRDPNSEWPELRVMTKDGTVVASQIERHPSPDILKYFNDGTATTNRFSITYACPGECVLRATLADGRSLSVPLVAGSGAGDKAEAGQMHIDTVDSAVHPASVYDPRTQIARSMAGRFYSAFYLLCPALVVLGLLATALQLVSAFVHKSVSSELVIALSAWCMVATRATLEGLLDISAFPATDFYQYTVPATYFAVAASCVSVAAWLSRRSFKGLQSILRS